VYTLLRGARLELLDDEYDTAADEQYTNRTGTDSVISIASKIYESVSAEFLISYANGSLSLNGTSIVASLNPQDIGYDYYVSRPTEMDSLIGTSAFALASFEMGRLDALTWR
jgi:rhamnogalacturonyl hydrolase YesR